MKEIVRNSKALDPEQLEAVSARMVGKTIQVFSDQVTDLTVLVLSITPTMIESKIVTPKRLEGKILMLPVVGVREVLKPKIPGKPEKPFDMRIFGVDTQTSGTRH